MLILGISAFYHDSAAAIIENGKVVAAAQEERFTRIKHDPSFPINAVKFCLDFANIRLEDLDAVAFYDKPLLKFERLLETYYAFSPLGLKSFLASMPIWLKEKMFLKRLLHESLKKIGNYNKRKLKLLFPEHHLSHAASTFYVSPFNEAAILTIDGVGEWATASICLGNGRDISILKELRFPHSLGLFYSAFTFFLGFRVNSGEYKLMGLAPYGNPDSAEVYNFVRLIKDNIIRIFDDGSIWLNQEYFSYATGLKMINVPKWEKLFGFKLRQSETELEQNHCNLGLAIQIITEEVILLMAKEAKRLTGVNNICLAGGVALNCVANGKLVKSGIFKEVYITPASGDAGGALGAALAAFHIYYEKPRFLSGKLDELNGSYLGPDVIDNDVIKTIKKYKAVASHHNDFNKLCLDIAKLLASGYVIGWIQGRMEFGPRALGGRSILGDPRNDEMQKKLNLKIKYRESFRPFAPSVLYEDCEQYFDQFTSSPYMLLVQSVKEDIRNSLPVNYNNFNIKDKLYFNHLTLPAITHIDFSARIQTVHKETNPKYYELLTEFKKITGCSVIVNTSFNVRGEPIVCTPEDAYRCFMRTEMDYLVIGNYFFEKSHQPVWVDNDNWEKEFKLD